MNILLTIHHYLKPDTGAPGATLKLGEEYRKLGHQVYYCGFDHLPAPFTGITKSLVFPQFLAFYLSKLSAQKAIDVVDASTGDAWIWGMLRQYQPKSPPILITRSHGLEHRFHDALVQEVQRENKRLSWKYPLYHGGFRLWEVANSLRAADLVFLLNHHELEYAVEKLGVKRERTHVVTNGVGESFLNLPFKPTPKTRDSTIRIAQIGSYIPRKGIQYSTPALNTILNRYPQVQVSFLGTGCSEADVYQDFDPGVRDRVQVVPHYTNESLPTLIQGHQIKLLSSLFEGLPLVLIEAMACGLTPITTALPGPMEIVRDGDNGILIPPCDRQAIEEALEKLITHRSYLETLRHQAYETAQNYSWARIARDTLSLYEKALSKKRYSAEPLSL